MAIVPTEENYSYYTDPGNGIPALTHFGGRLGYRQTGKPKDYNLALGYNRSHAQTLNAVYVGPDAYNKPVYSVQATHANIISQLRLSDDLSRAKNRAYAKVLESWRPIKASSGVSLAQMGEGAGMVAARSVQLLSASRSLLKGDVKQFLNTLFTLNPSMKNGVPKQFLPEGMVKGKLTGTMQMTRRNRRLLESRWKRKVTADAGGVWLEAWFGWLPAVQDIHSAAETLVTPIMDHRYKGSSGGKIRDIGLGNGSADVDFVFKYSGILEVTNRNLALAESLGLLNPFNIAWDLIKMSWLIGWFGNFQQVIGSWTDHAGVKTSNQCSTLYATWKAALREKTVEYPPGYLYSNSAGYIVYRSIETMAYPTLQLNIPNGLSVTRGATAISLLVQTLGKLSSKS